MLPFIVSWGIILIGMVLLIVAPKCIGKRREVIHYNNEDNILADRKMLFSYYKIAGILIMILGVILVIYFSDELPNLLNILKDLTSK